MVADICICAVSEVQLRTQANGGFTQIDIPAVDPWATLIVRAAN